MRVVVAGRGLQVFGRGLWQGMAAEENRGGRGGRQVLGRGCRRG